MAVTGRRLLDFVNARGGDEKGVCTCGHWFEEHHDGTCDACLENACDRDDPHVVADHAFVYSDEFTAESEYLNERARELGFPFDDDDLPGWRVPSGVQRRDYSLRYLRAGESSMWDPESTSEPAIVLRRMVEMFDSGQVHEAASVVSPAYVDHQEPGAGASGLETFQSVVARARLAFPDLTVYIEDLIAEGDRVAARLRWTATDRTGKPFEAESIDIVRVVDGKAAEHWGISRGWPLRT